MSISISFLLVCEIISLRENRSRLLDSKSKNRVKTGKEESEG
jgi:hypothetical protein